LAYWDDLLNQGYRIAGTASIDLHDLSKPSEKTPHPYNCVHSHSSDASELIEAVRQGAFYCTDQGEFHFEVLAGESVLNPGDVVADSVNQLKLNIVLTNMEGFLRVVHNGESQEVVPIKNGFPISMSVPPHSTGKGWIRGEVYRDADCNDMTALANPIYYDFL